MVANCLGCLRTAIANQVDNLYTVALLSYTFTLAGDQDTRRMLITRLDQAAQVTGTWLDESDWCTWVRTIEQLV